MLIRNLNQSRALAMIEITFKESEKIVLIKKTDAHLAFRNVRNRSCVNDAAP